MYYVYVLQDETGSFYTGFTQDLRRRVEAHNAGASAATRGRCWRLVYYEAYVSAAAGRRRELQIKRNGNARKALMARIVLSLGDGSD